LLDLPDNFSNVAEKYQFAKVQFSGFSALSYPKVNYSLTLAHQNPAMIRLPKSLPIILFSGFLVFFILSCRKRDQIDTSQGLQLSFSTDTVFFDTVFPTVGSVTKRLVVYNTNKNKISISDVRLSGGQGSMFRLNVNGTPAISATNIEIAGNDSLFVFVRVTVDPNNQNLPFVVSDSIQFTTNGSLQHIKLVAWGRNAIFYRGTNLKGNIIWDSLKAHVIFGSIRIDTNSSLTIMPGTRVYFHKDAYMSVSFQSTLKIPGTLDHPVRFQGDRMDPFYKDLPGQWGGIFLESGSRDHVINYVYIKNGSYGFAVDSMGTQGSPMLAISNSIIQNMSSAGIFAFGSSITSVNLVIGDCGGSSLALHYGGSYDFRQLTIGNFWSSSVRISPAVYLSNYSYDTTGQKISNPLLKAYFGNVILYGSNEEEIVLDSLPSVPFEYTFDHAILKTQLKTTNPFRFLNCDVNKDPRFVDIQKMNYQIDSISPAINMGAPMGIPFDIRGNDRGSTPDLGAYEYVRKLKNRN
jgi:hypothetical protein